MDDIRLKSYEHSTWEKMCNDLKKILGGGGVSGGGYSGGGGSSGGDGSAGEEGGDDESRKEELERKKKELEEKREAKEEERREREMKRSYYKAIHDIIFKINNEAKQFANAWLKVNDEAFKTARTLGVQADKLESYQKNMVKQAWEMSIAWGATYSEMNKLQQGYSDAVRRNMTISNDNMKDLLAVQRLGGETGVQIVGELDKYGIGIKNASIAFAGVQQKSEKFGLNAKVTSEHFKNNIKMASKYNFREGIEGVTKMTMLSEKFKFNLESIGNVAEKLSTVEGAIDVSAKMQMLGGSYAAAFGNPIQVLYEGLNDTEALTNRILNMTKGKFTFNEATGEFNTDAITKRFLSYASESLGMSYDDLFSMSINQGKASLIERNINARLTDAEKSFIINQAQYDSEKGWFISYLEDGETREKKITELTKDNIESIRGSVAREEDLGTDVKAIRQDLHDWLISEGIRSVSGEERKAASSSTVEATKGKMVHGIMNPMNNAVANGALDNGGNTGFWPKAFVIGTIGLGLVGTAVGTAGSIRAARTMRETRNYVNAMKGIRAEENAIRTGRAATAVSEEANIASRMGNIGAGSNAARAGAMNEGQLNTLSRLLGKGNKNANEIKQLEKLKTKFYNSYGESASLERVNAVRNGGRIERVAGNTGNLAREGEVIANTGAKTGSRLTNFGEKARAFNATKGARVGGAAIGIVAAGLEMYSGFKEASDARKERDLKLREIEQTNYETEHKKNMAKERVKFDAREKELMGRYEAIGAGIGAVGGAVVGGVGGVVLGAAGGMVGRNIGKAVARGEERRERISQELDFYWNMNGAFDGTGIPLPVTVTNLGALGGIEQTEANNGPVPVFIVGSEGNVRQSMNVGGRIDINMSGSGFDFNSLSQDQKTKISEAFIEYIKTTYGVSFRNGVPT